MFNKIKTYINTIVSLSLVLFLMTNCSWNSEMSMANLQILMEFLENKDSSSNKDEDEQYLDVSGINKDLYGVLSYKEKVNPFSSLNDKYNSQINFNFDEEQKKWKPIPDSGKIPIKTKQILLFSLKGVVEIGEINLDKESEKVTLSSIVGGEKEVRNFKYLVLSLSSKKSGKLEIKDSDLEKLKDKKIDLKKEPEEFVKDPIIKTALQGKTKATQKDIFGYDVDESVLVQNLKKKFNSILESQIKELDGITESVDVYASDTKPKFDSKSYTINELDDVNLTYIENSINQDDLAGTLSYEVELSVSRIEDEKRKIKVSYSGFKSTNEKQNKFNSIYNSDIKKLDGITPDIGRYPSEYPEPQFNSNPYTLKSLNDVTITYVKGSKKAPDLAGSYSYEVELSVPKLNKKRKTIEYRPNIRNNFKQVFRDLFAEENLFKSITVSDIKKLDGIAPDKDSYPSTISAPNFNANPYAFNNLPKEWVYDLTSLSGVTINYVAGSLKGNDVEGTLSYQVELSFPKLDKRTLSIIYTEKFKSTVSHTTWSDKATYGIKFFPDGTKLVSAHRKGTIWNVSDGTVSETITRANMCDLDISRDGKYIITTPCNNNAQIAYYNSTGTYISSFTAYGYSNLDSLMAPAFSPDGKKVSAGIWTYHTGSRLLPPVIIFDFQSVLAGGTRKNIFKKLDVKVTSDNKINSVIFSPDSKKLFVASNDKKITIWEVSTGSLLKTINTSFHPYGLDISADGTKIISGHGSSIGSWDASTGAFLKSYSSSKPYNSNFANSPRFSPDGTKIVSTFLGDHIMIWNVADANNSPPSKILRDYDSNRIYEIQISPDGTKIVSASDSNLKVWEDKRADKTILDK